MSDQPDRQSQPELGQPAVVRSAPGHRVNYSSPLPLRRQATKPWIRRRRLLYPLLFVCTILATISLLWWFSPVLNQLTGEQEYRGSQLVRAMGNVLSPEQSLDVSFGGRKQLTLLLVGLDHVPETRRDPGTIRRSDSVLVAKTDFDTKQVRVLSIPRDGWIEHWHHGESLGYDKLGHTYALGQQEDMDNPASGIERTEESVEHLLGIGIDYYVVIQFEGLVKLVDALGGLWIDVDKNMRYRDRAGGLDINLKKGPQHLNGEQVVQYARFRHDATGDIARMGRQQNVLRLIFEKIVATRNPAKLAELAAIANESVMTNLTVDQLLALCQHSDEFAEDGFKSLTLPSFWNREPGHEIDLPGVYRGMSVQAIFPGDCQTAAQFLNDLAPPPPPVIEETQVGQVTP